MSSRREFLAELDDTLDSTNYERFDGFDHLSDE
jgi:hypothetical protein